MHDDEIRRLRSGKSEAEEPTDGSAVTLFGLPLGGVPAAPSGSCPFEASYLRSRPESPNRPPMRASTARLPTSVELYLMISTESVSPPLRIVREVSVSMVLG